MQTKRITYLFVFLCWTIVLNAQVSINEYSASNMNQFIDNNEKFEDWIELHNAGEEAVDLSGWFLSDKEDKPEKWTIPDGTMIAANGFLRFWCSSRDWSEDGHYHTNFKLTQTKGNEYAVLSQPDGSIIESIELELTLLAHSRAKAVDGGTDWVICTNPSINTSNADSTTFFSAYTAQPEMDINSGFYAESITVTITNNEPNSILRYSTDGNLPTEDSPEYTEPLTITETTLLKALAFSSDSTILSGKIAFNTFFIDETFTLPVISIGADEVLDLANGDRELRPIGSIEYFDPSRDLKSRSYGELNSHGQDSWQNPHRSLDYVCRDEMGYNKAIDAPLFHYSDRTEHQRLMLRASGDDNYPATDAAYHDGSAHVRDEYVHELALQGGMKLDVRAVERIVVFLNGQYWGVYGLRERPVDHDYTGEYYDQGKYDLQYLLTWGESWAEYGGDEAFDDWAVVRDFILDNDMSIPENYQVAKDNIQLTSLIDYMIANLNSVASDWLNYNTGWWRGLDPDGDHKKWGYILWDNDATFDYYINYSGVPNTDPDAVPCDIDDISEYMDEFFNNGWSGDGDQGKHEKIFLKLQEESDEFRQLYYSRQADLMNTVYTCENMLSTLDSMIATIEPEMPRHIERWGNSVAEWKSNVRDLRDFVEQRCELLDDGMVDCFDVTGPYNLTLLVEPEGVEEIDLNTLDIRNFPWSGNYFGNMENIIKARAFDEDVYEFVRWETKNGSVLSTDEFSFLSSITLTEGDTLTAHFDLASSASSLDANLSFHAYPNPTAGNLTINYELEKATAIQLSLHTLLGEHIADLTDENDLRQAGHHIKELDLSTYKLSSGLYFLTFKAGNAQKTVKISLLE